MKACTRCKIVKPLDQFPKRATVKDGRASRCNACMSEIQRLYKATPKGAAARKATAKRYRESAHGQARRKADHASPKQVAQRAAYALTDQGKVSAQRSRKRSYQKIVQTEEGQRRLNARLAVTHAVEGGRLPRVSSLFCERCHSSASAYHHDLGYAERYWLHVIPVCHECHAKLHSR